MNAYLRQLEQDSGATYTFYAQTVGKSSVLTHGADQPREAASTIKLLVLIVLLRHVQEGVISLDQQIIIGPERIVKNGSGVLQYCRLPNSQSVYDLALLMMSISDNIATNVLIELIGKASINDLAASVGLVNTRIHTDSMDFASTLTSRDPRFSTTTAHEMGLLLEQLLAGGLLNATYTAMALKLMQRVQNSIFLRDIPYGTERMKAFGSKTGSFYYADDCIIINECGYIIDLQGQRHIFSVFSQHIPTGPHAYSSTSPARKSFADVSALIWKKLQESA